MRRAALFTVVLLGLVACQRDKPAKDKQVKTNISRIEAGSGSGAKTARGVEQVPAPDTLKAPPADATKTASGLTYKKLATVESGASPGKNDTVQVLYTGWIQASGETFFTTKTKGQPIALPLATAAPGFAEALQLLRKGEKALMWIPPSIGYKQTPPAGKAETLVYELELVDIIAAPTIPPDVAAPPATAQTLKSGTKYVVVKQGTGTEKARYFDTVTFNYTGWDKDGKQLDSTEVRKRPATVPPFRKPAPLEEVLTSMVAGERVRIWVEASKLAGFTKPVPEGNTELVCYELELLTIEKAKAEPPPVPKDVEAPPANAKKSPKGVSYVFLGPPKDGPKPKASDTVKVHYTGWQTNGRMFDSSVIRGEPATFSLQGVIAGWTDAIPVMSVGDKARFWIPAELAYKGNPSRPQGVLVFDIEMLEITPGQAASANPHGAAMEPKKIPAPDDVAAPPKDALKSPKGVSYKILSKGPGTGPNPKPEDTLTFHYTGWQTNGEMFDSSVARGEPLVYPLNKLIPGWIDTLPLIKIGDKIRLWIPEELAYGGRPGSPSGMLVFDIELLEIKAAQ